MSGTARLRLPLAIGLGGILALGAFAPRQVNRVGGTFTMTYSQQTPQALGDTEGHVLLSTSSTGANQSTGPTSYMPDAAVTNSELADLIQGNGSHQGYVTLSLSGAIYVAQWRGAVTTVVGPDHQPVTTFKGAWTNVRGPSGHGTYAGRITGPNSYTVDWEGEVAAN